MLPAVFRLHLLRQRKGEEEGRKRERKYLQSSALCITQEVVKCGSLYNSTEITCQGF